MNLETLFTNAILLYAACFVAFVIGGQILYMVIVAVKSLLDRKSDDKPQ